MYRGSLRLFPRTPLTNTIALVFTIESAEYVAAMEDVLDIYQRPQDGTNPVVCVDETSKQHIKETRKPLPMVEGSPCRYDCEYERNGVSNLFIHDFRTVCGMSAG